MVNDTVEVIISNSEYEKLIRESEQNNIIRKFAKKNVYVSTEDLKTILDIQDTPKKTLSFVEMLEGKEGEE